MTTQKTLYILRHAKAETGAAGQDDHERALTQAGRDAATALGAYVRRQGFAFDRVLCSSALRTRQTLECLQVAAPVDYSDRIYLASLGELLRLITDMDDAAQHLLLVGHNPGLHQLSLQLAQTGANGLLDTLAIKFPTCTLAALTLEMASWHDILHVQGKLEGFVTPALLAQA